MPQLSKRAQSILYALVTEFIATGEPIGSRTLTRKYGFDLSPATVRNVLADLEDTGFLVQPHTSAGRVPTEAAFRLFIDALMRVRQLSTGASERIHEYFEKISPGTDILRETGKLLCQLTGAPALLARPRIESRTLMKLRFIATRPGEVLSVVVLSDGTVENRFFHIDDPLSEREIERLHGLLESVANGKTLAAIRDHFARVVGEQRDELAALHRLGLILLDGAIAGKGGAEGSVVLEEPLRFFEQPEFVSADRARELMRALEDREKLITLLDQTLESTRVQVFLGAQTHEMVGVPLSIVATSYRDSQGQPSGALGIIGPTRMDYPSLVPLVGATADAMSAAMARSILPYAGDRDPDSRS